MIVLRAKILWDIAGHSRTPSHRPTIRVARNSSPTRCWTLWPIAGMVVALLIDTAPSEVDANRRDAVEAAALRQHVAQADVARGL